MSGPLAGVLAALLEERRSGTGQVVDAAIVDGTAHVSTLFVGLVSAGSWSDRRGTNLLDETFATSTRDAWAAVSEVTEPCVEPVLSSAETPSHPHLATRHTYVENHGVVQPAPAPRFSRTAATLGAPPPSVPGAVTGRTLAAWGIEHVDALLDSGAATQA